MKTNAILETIPARRKSDPCCETVSPSLTVSQTASLALRMKAVGDDTRLAILDLLVQHAAPLCVCDLTPHFAQNQPTISHHLRLLREAELIDTEKRGIWAYYWATEEGRKLLSAVAPLA